MKLFLLLLTLVCVAQSQDVPFACNMKVFTPAERKQHEALSRHILAAVASLDERERGYSFRFDPARVSLVDLARWTDGEKKCCPFFDFQLNLDGSSQVKLSLTLSGREGVKQFIREEFRPIFSARSER